MKAYNIFAIKLRLGIGVYLMHESSSVEFLDSSDYPYEFSGIKLFLPFIEIMLGEGSAILEEEGEVTEQT